MRQWLKVSLLALALLILAATARWWISPLLTFLGTNSEIIQSLADTIQILLWLAAGGALLFGWQHRPRREQPPPTSTTQAKGEGIVAQRHSVAARQVAVGRDVHGDIILVADVNDLWDVIRRRPPEEDLRRSTEEYLKCLVDRYQYLELKGMGVSDRVPLRLPLIDVYVPLRARVELPEGETWARDLRLAGRRPTQEEMEAMGQRLSEPQPVLNLMQENDGLIVLGDPGAGKTTFLKYLTLMLAQGRAEDLDMRPRLPILVPLSAYANALADGDIPLDAFIGAYYARRGIDLPVDAMLAEALDQGGALILLDGLDEVRDLGQRHLVVARVVDFFTQQRRRGNKFVLTSRIVGYREVRPAVEGLAECTLVDFDDEDMKLFVDKWTAAIERAAHGDTRVATLDAEQEREELLQAIHRNPGVRRLAANPLLLTILALMKRQGITLPERRVELYQKYVETLLKHWNLARGLDRPPSRDLDVVETIRVLAPLALWMQETSPGRGLVKQGDLQRQLEAIYAERGFDDPEGRARQFLADVREYAGLLLERGPREYGFIHLTFQEYLAAVAIAQKGQQDIEWRRWPRTWARRPGGRWRGSPSAIWASFSSGMRPRAPWCGR
ncbi:MAG: NACHT domain-containing protein [Chloroflexi bacterium]|nr:NACHT domain-containing protein [Chloroflexota bacterium]